MSAGLGFFLASRIKILEVGKPLKADNWIPKAVSALIMCLSLSAAQRFALFAWLYAGGGG